MSMREIAKIISPPRSVSIPDLIMKVCGVSGVNLKLGKFADELNATDKDKVKLTDDEISELSVKSYFQDVGLCLRERGCPKSNCGKMRIVFRDGRLVFRCRKCEASSSMFKGTFLAGTRLVDWKILVIFYRMAQWRSYTQALISDEVGIHRNSVGLWCGWIREALAVYNRYNVIKLGGPGKKIYIDEAFIGTKMKYGRGDARRGLHDPMGKKAQVLVMTDSDGKVVIYHIRHANAETIRPIFERHFLPGSEAHTDGALVYAQIPTWGNGKDYVHDWVNHSIKEFARKTGAGSQQKTISSNRVEGVISDLKKFLRKHFGFQWREIWKAIDEFCFHRNCLSGSISNLDNFIRIVTEYGIKDIYEAPGSQEASKGHSLHFDYLKKWGENCECPAASLETCHCDWEKKDLHEQFSGEEDVDINEDDEDEDKPSDDIINDPDY